MAILERDIQIAFVQYVLTMYMQREDFIRRMFFHVPNGVKLGARNAPAMMHKLKQQGVLPGVPDILYLYPRGMWNFLAIELKTEARRNEKNGGLSDEQLKWQDDARRAGALVFVAYGLDEAIEIFDQYMHNPSR